MSILSFLPNYMKARLRERILQRLGAMDRPTDWKWTFYSDGLATVHNTDFLHQEPFESAYQKGFETDSWKSGNIRYRAYIACWAAMQTRNVPGDYVECGVNRGGLARAQMEMIDFNNLNKKFWLVDTFQGFPEAQKPLVSRAMPTDQYSECYNDVVKTFASFSNTRLVRGIVPEVLPQVGAEKICYLSLDMNCAEPEVAALEYFWPRISPGGIVLMDDYAYDGYERQKEFLDDYAKKNDILIVGLATGQGMIIKN